MHAYYFLYSNKAKRVKLISSSIILLVDSSIRFDISTF